MYDKDNLRRYFAGNISPLIRLLDALGIKPIHITLAGPFFTAAACYTYYNNYYFTTLLLMTIGRFCDAIDGAFARMTNQTTPFGGFLDSVIDRYSEFAIAGTILFVYREHANLYYLSFILFLGISLMSYTRALYDKYHIPCPGNPFEYFERGVLLLAFFLVDRLDLWLIVTAIGTNISVLHRVYHFYRETRSLSTE